MSNNYDLCMKFSTQEPLDKDLFLATLKDAMLLYAVKAEQNVTVNLAYLQESEPASYQS